MRLTNVADKLKYIQETPQILFAYVLVWAGM